jgi:poly-gamma-glutamate capsule biosynthesis protein CapA/YwtB (metallophosphatase superfamily)
MKSKINWLIFSLVVLIAVGLLSVNLFFPVVEEFEAIIFISPEKINFHRFLNQKQKLLVDNPEVSLIAVGDISYSRGISTMIRKENDWNYPLQEVKNYLQSGDLVFGNLETPITPGPEVFSGEMVFRSDPKTASTLAEAGFSILSLANNHTPNWGEPGLLDTFQYLDQVDINYVGAGANLAESYQPVYIEEQGLKFAFLAYNDTDVVPDYYGAGEKRVGTALMDKEKMITAVQTARQQADYVIVSMHSGKEYVFYPNQHQIDFAHATIDAGADLVLGHHPHVVQSMEKYQNKFIFYSLGNFIFDQNWSAETSESLILKFYFNQQGLKQISFVPVVIKNNCQPQLADSIIAQKILDRLVFPLNNQVVYYWDVEQKDFLPSTLAILNFQESNSALPDSQITTADLDNDNLLEIYSLNQGRLVVTENSQILWQSPVEWWIDSFVLADANHDGSLNLNLSLWKAGDFGSSQPFWIKENDPSVKNHFFVLNLVNNQIKIVWGSSNLDQPNCEFRFADLDNDGQEELIVLEGEYTDNFQCQGKYLAVWKWQEWGFFNQWRSSQGNFFHLETTIFGEQSYMIINEK